MGQAGSAGSEDTDPTWPMTHVGSSKSDPAWPVTGRVRSGQVKPDLWPSILVRKRRCFIPIRSYDRFSLLYHKEIFRPTTAFDVPHIIPTVRADATFSKLIIFHERTCSQSRTTKKMPIELTLELEMSLDWCDLFASGKSKCRAPVLVTFKGCIGGVEWLRKML